MAPTGGQLECHFEVGVERELEGSEKGPLGGKLETAQQRSPTTSRRGRRSSTEGARKKSA
jgi:hypothetical protein